MEGSLLHLLFVVFLAFPQIWGVPLEDGSSESLARVYLEQLEAEYSKECNENMEKRWAYVTNVTTENEQASVAAANKYLAYKRTVQATIKDKFPDWNSFTDPTIKREFKFLAMKGPADMKPEEVEEMNKLAAQMESAYSSAKVCEYGSSPPACKLLSLEPDLIWKLRTVKDYDELSYYWNAWHEKIEEVVPTKDYARFIQLQNTYAKANNYSDMGEFWSVSYDNGKEGFSAKAFEKEMYGLWEELKPYYNKLHAYVRMKLRKSSPYADKIKKYGYLPANIMGNMWGQEWSALEASTKPFPNAPSLNATPAMEMQGWTVDKMFEVADEFFSGMGLLPMTQTFKEKSMKVKPTDRTVVCHASAEDMCKGKGSTDFRIKMCTNVNQNDLTTIHHEMGHIEYFMQYTDQPITFRDGANPGFHEAIGDCMALSVTTPKHLQCVLNLDLGYSSLCETSSNTTQDVTETDLNFLYYMALAKFPLFPFAISMDTWRWRVFDGSIPESDYNKKWWEIREQNQGIVPPTERNLSSTGLDAASKYHIAANVEYIRYFVSYILQFQFYESLCIKAGEFNPDDPQSKPLYQCDFSGKTAAGEAFGNMMKLGFSKPWPEALKVITGKENIDISSILRYFKPLFEYIETELQVNGEVVGFGGREFEESVAKDYISGFYEKEASRYCNLASVADFSYQTNLLSKEAEEESQNASKELAEFELKEYSANISQFDYQQFVDEDLKRQLKFMNAIGTSKLSSQDLLRYNKVLLEMSKVYGTAKVCPYNKQGCNKATEGLALDPDLTQILSEMGSYNEMAYYWHAWRDESGKKIRALYKEYVDLSNKAAELNGYNNMGDFWLLRYESDTFRDDIENVWKEVRQELYLPLYNYVRHKLSKRYPQMSPTEAMPAHVFGNMWAQSWTNILPYVLPYPESPSFDVTEQLKQMGDDPSWVDERAKRKMIFDFANTFFKRLGLADMQVAYGGKAMILKPNGTEVICHASAWDMCDKNDFRIKMCTELTHQDFITAHHELGHIQYYLQYKDLPITYRSGANPGFHEAIGDVVALSVSTPHHLEKLGLLTEKVTEESMLNYLMQMALEKIAFLPFGYLIDSYRWQVFNGKIPQQNLTYNWIKMRADYQGITPPFRRNEEDFDAGAKYHVPANTPYIRYFVSFILQFQIHQKLCEVAGHPPTKPLHECNINANAAAGKLFGDILRAGASKSWQEVLKSVTGEDKLNPAAIISYFQPLVRFLKQTETNEKYPVGWDRSNIDYFFGEGEFVTPPEYTTPAPTQPFTSTPVANQTDPDQPITTTAVSSQTDPDEPETSATSAVTEGTTSSGSRSSTTEASKEKGQPVALIAIGVSLGVIVIVCIVGYFAWRRCRR